MHRFVSENARGDLGEFAIPKERDSAKVGRDGALFQSGRKSEYVDLRLQLVDRERVLRLGRDRLATQLLQRCSERRGMLLVMPLELLRDRERRLPEQTAFGADLIGRNRLVFGAKCSVQDAQIALGRSSAFEEAASASRPASSATAPAESTAPDTASARRRDASMICGGTIKVCFMDSPVDR